MKFTATFANLLTLFAMSNVAAGKQRGSGMMRHERLPSSRQLNGNMSGMGGSGSSGDGSGSCNSGYKLAEISIVVHDAVAVGLAFEIFGETCITDVLTDEEIWFAGFFREIVLEVGLIDSGKYTLIKDEVCLAAYRCYAFFGSLEPDGDPEFGISFDLDIEVKWDGETMLDVSQTIIPGAIGELEITPMNFGDICGLGRI